MSFTALGNFQRGYLDRVLGRGGSLSTAKRIDRMRTMNVQKRNEGSFYLNPSIVDSKFNVALWDFIQKRGKISEAQKDELIKRLLQQLEMHTYGNLDEDIQNRAIKEFEENL